MKSASKREQSNSFELPSDSRFDGAKTENSPFIAHRSSLQTPPSLRATSPNLGEESWCVCYRFSSFKFHVPIHFVPLSQGDEPVGRRGYDINGKVKTENGNLRVSKSRSMVGTLRAASENDKQNGRCTQRPYIPER